MRDVPLGGRLPARTLARVDADRRGPRAHRLRDAGGGVLPAVALQVKKTPLIGAPRPGKEVRNGHGTVSFDVLSVREFPVLSPSPSTSSRTSAPARPAGARRQPGHSTVTSPGPVSAKDAHPDPVAAGGQSRSPSLPRVLHRTTRPSGGSLIGLAGCPSHVHPPLARFGGLFRPLECRLRTLDQGARCVPGREAPRSRFAGGLADIPRRAGEKEPAAGAKRKGPAGFRGPLEIQPAVLPRAPVVGRSTAIEAACAGAARADRAVGAARAAVPVARPAVVVAGIVAIPGAVVARAE